MTTEYTAIQTKLLKYSEFKYIYILNTSRKSLWGPTIPKVNQTEDGCFVQCCSSVASYRQCWESCWPIGSQLKTRSSYSVSRPNSAVNFTRSDKTRSRWQERDLGENNQARFTAWGALTSQIIIQTVRLALCCFVFSIKYLRNTAACCAPVSRINGNTYVPTRQLNNAD